MVLGIIGATLFGSAAASAATISAGAGLLGGALQRRDARKNPPKTDLVGLRAEAERAGFNPLTALNATGGAGFQTGRQPVSIGAVLQNFGNNVAGIVKANDPVAAATEKQNLELMKAQTDMLKSQAVMYNIQGKTMAQRRTGGGGARSNVPEGFEIEQGMVVPLEQNQKVAPVENMPLLWQFRTGADGSRQWVGLNPDAFEIGIGELIGGGLIHGTAAAIQAAKRTKDNIEGAFHRVDNPAARKVAPRIQFPSYINDQLRDMTTTRP